MNHYFRYREPIMMLGTVVILLLIGVIVWTRAQADTTKTVDGILPQPIAEEVTESPQTLEYQFN